MNNRDPERRRSARMATTDQHHVRAALVRPGQLAEVIDLSVDGTLVETERGLRPGANVEMQLERASTRTFVRGRVLRCAVSQLHASCVKYRSAIAFERHLPWFADHQGYAVPSVDIRTGRDESADATHTVL
jgi:hypothetical protein